jgi:cytochrome c553
MFHMNINNTVALALIVVFTSTTTFAQNDNSKPSQPRTGDHVAGKAKSLLCQGCHGEDGNSLATYVPKLAGQNAAYISKQVRNFQAGIRKHAVMNDLAATVNDDELTDIAAYFASQLKMSGDGPSANPTGKNLLLHGEASRKIVACNNCHGINGKGLEPNPSNIPVIGGQNKDYLSRQLTNFKKGDRSNSPDGVMNENTKSLTEAEIESLADYVSRL